MPAVTRCATSPACTKHELPPRWSKYTLWQPRHCILSVMPQARPGGLTQISLRHDTQTDTNAGVLLEKQLVLFCPNIGLLSTCVLSLIPLLRPFTWQSLLLPVLPDNLLSFLEAPVPFVIGVQVSSCAATPCLGCCLSLLSFWLLCLLLWKSWCIIL